jgi:hypothetical protein
MDPASLAASFVATQTAQFQMAVAAKMLKMNADSGQAVSQLLASAADNAAKAVNPPGVGQNLDITI